MPPPADVMLADCRMRGGLAVLRSLARSGASPVVVTSDAGDIVLRSRYAKNLAISPSLDTDPDGFVEQVRSTAETYGVRLIIPITDRAVGLLDANRAVFPEGVRLALPPSGSVRRVLDKAENLEMAERIGVPCPKRFALESPELLSDMVGHLGLPIVLKNPKPEVREEVGGLPFRFLVVREMAELETLIERFHDREVRPLYQEYASGQTRNFCCFAAEGETVAIHQYISLRRGSHAGIFREVIPLDPHLEHHVREILRALEWSGVAHIQFVVDKEAGKAWYMETNGRFWASTQGSVNAGWDFPLWTYEYFLNGKKPDVPRIQIGSRTVYRKADLEVLLSYLRGYQSPTFYTDPGRWWAVRQHLAIANPSVKSDVWSWTDPRPGLWDFVKYGKSLLSAVAGRVKDRNGRAGTTGH